jgi:hypothetical protein
MAASRTSKKTSSRGSFKTLDTQGSVTHKPIVLVPAASSCSAFNYYANNDDEREAAAARFRADVSRTTRKTKRR